MRLEFIFAVVWIAAPFVGIAIWREDFVRVLDWLGMGDGPGVFVSLCILGAPYAWVGHVVSKFLGNKRIKLVDDDQ